MAQPSDDELEYEVLKLIIAYKTVRDSKGAKGQYFLERSIDTVLALIANRGMVPIMTQLGLYVPSNGDRKVG